MVAHDLKMAIMPYIAGETAKLGNYGGKPAFAATDQPPALFSAP